MKYLDVSYTVSFGKGEGGDADTTVEITDEQDLWVKIVKRMTDEIESGSINEAVEEIKKEIKSYKDAKEKGEKYEIELRDSCFNTFIISYDELSKIDWDKINVNKFVSDVYSQVENYEEESYKELYGDFDDEYEDENDDEYNDEEDDSDDWVDEFDVDDDYTCEITGIHWG